MNWPKTRLSELFLLVVIAVILLVVGVTVLGKRDSRSTKQETPVSQQETKPETVSTGQGLAFGPFHLPTANYGMLPYTGAFLDLSKLSVAEAQEALDKAQSYKMGLIITLAGGGARFRDTTRRFSFDLFRQGIDRFKDLDLVSYYQSATVRGILILDEPQDRNNWGGETLPFGQIRQAASYVKSIWPDVPVGAGSNPSFLAGGGWSAGDLDFVLVPFTQKRLCPAGRRPGCYGTSVSEWLEGVVRDAKTADLGLALSINVLDGGSPPGSPLSASQLETYGKAFAQEPAACALTFWKWDESYFSQADVMAAINNIASAATSHSAKPCLPITPVPLNNVF